MGIIKIGGYRQGRATYDHDGLNFRNIDGKAHAVPFSDRPTRSNSNHDSIALRRRHRV